MWEQRDRQTEIDKKRDKTVGWQERSYYFEFLKPWRLLKAIVNICNLSTQKAEAGGSPVLVWGQSGLHNESVTNCSGLPDGMFVEDISSSYLNSLFTAFTRELLQFSSQIPSVGVWIYYIISYPSSLLIPSPLLYVLKGEEDRKSLASRWQEHPWQGVFVFPFHVSWSLGQLARKWTRDNEPWLVLLHNKDIIESSF